MELTSSRQDAAVACFDPECPGVAEPEQDGDHTYYECTTCGHASGYTKVATVAVAPDGTSCAAGVPDDLRRAASAAMNNAITAAQPAPLFQITRRTDASTS